MADPYPRLNVNPFQIPLNVRIVRDANGAPRWVRGRRLAVPGLVALHGEEQRLHRSAAAHAVSPAVDDERAVRSAAAACWSTSRYVGSRGVGLLGKINLAVPVDPRVTPVNGFTDIYDRLGRVINPDFFVPTEFLGLNRNGGIPAADQHRPLDVSQPAVEAAREDRPDAGRPTWRTR